MTRGKPFLLALQATEVPRLMPRSPIAISVQFAKHWLNIASKKALAARYLLVKIPTRCLSLP